MNDETSAVDLSLFPTMVLLNHPSIIDGWFREISTQWPGQAMMLKVDKILHIEKSLYQDILVFESATFGNVLVLDGVIQCTERDEFSYQEMIAHLPLASHPNPEQVLVIGGGDGGVIREVLKHSSVTKVMLCEIDEAVSRVSRQYLPNMAAALSDPRVTIHIGDGFQFLSKHEGTYDVIITDSSDPVGPAEPLFQKPYFQLLHNALRPGGHVSTQGECLWVHLELITTLTRTMKDIFPVVEYAYTTIPSHPSAQIGFILCAKDPERNLRKPVRDVEGTKYYNSAIHAASFVLPEFGRAMLEEGKNTLPKFGRNLRKELEIVQAGREERKILLLGSGYVAKPCAEYLARDPSNRLTIACRTLARAQALAQNFSNAHAISLDATDIPELEQAVAAHDLVIGLIPPIHEPAVIRAAIKGKTHVVMTSYVWPWMRALDEEARAAGIVILNEIGLDPGIDHLYAIKTIAEVHAKGGKVKHFLSYCGGLPAPECADNPLGYKFSWSARLMLSGLTSSASYLANGGQGVVIDGKDLMSHAKPYYISPAFAFMAYPNRNSKPFREWYGIPEAETVIRGTLRYQGFPEFIRALVKLGWFDDEKKAWLSEEAGLTWAQVMQKVIDAASTDEHDLINKARQICGFLSETESERIISGLRWLGLLSQTDRAIVRNGNLIDTLCGRLEALMQYEPGERDMIMLQHKFFVEWADGKTDVITATMERYGSAVPGGYSAMALTVGLPCAIAVQLILDGKLFNGSPGVHAPYDEEICAPLRKELEAEGIGFVERVL